MGSYPEYRRHSTYTISQSPTAIKMVGKRYRISELMNQDVHISSRILYKFLDNSKCVQVPNRFLRIMPDGSISYSQRLTVTLFVSENLKACCFENWQFHALTYALLDSCQVWDELEEIPPWLATVQPTNRQLRVYFRWPHVFLGRHCTFPTFIWPTR